MTDTKRDRIEAINLKIVALMLKRARAQRHGTWAQECALYDEMAELEKQIKLIEAE